MTLEDAAPLLDGWRGWPLPRVMLAAAAAGGVIFAPFTMLANAPEDRDWLVLVTWTLSVEILLGALIWPQLTRSLRWLLDTLLGAVLLSLSMSMTYRDQVVRLVISLALPAVVRIALAEIDTARRDALADRERRLLDQRLLAVQAETQEALEQLRTAPRPAHWWRR